MGKIDSGNNLSSEKQDNLSSNFSSKIKAIFSFILVFSFILMLTLGVGEFVIWLMDLLLTAVH